MILVISLEKWTTQTQPVEEMSSSLVFHIAYIAFDPIAAC